MINSSYQFVFKNGQPFNRRMLLVIIGNHFLFSDAEISKYITQDFVGGQFAKDF